MLYYITLEKHTLDLLSNQKTVFGIISNSRIQPLPCTPGRLYARRCHLSTYTMLATQKRT